MDSEKQQEDGKKQNLENKNKSVLGQAHTAQTGRHQNDARHLRTKGPQKPAFAAQKIKQNAEEVTTPSAGAVLRRKPVSDTRNPLAPKKWEVSRPRFSNVDNKDKGYQQGGNNLPSNVDNKDSLGQSNLGHQAPEMERRQTLSNVDNSEFDLPPESQYIEKAIPTRLKGPQPYKPAGRSGPDMDVVELLRAAKKQQVVDRARARGRDPNEGAEEVVTGVTRSAKTQQQYMERGNQLLARYRRERGIISSDLLSLDTIEFVDWLLSLKPTLKPTTWRPYKQSAKAVLSTLPEADEAIGILDADNAETGSEPERKPKKNNKEEKRDLPRRTSSLKSKSIPKADLTKIVNYLKFLSASKYAKVLADWLIAGIATGLRPVEWMATSLEIIEDPEAPKGRYVWLYVLNAKHTNNRGNGAVRTIDLTSVSDETMGAIKRMSDRGREWLIRDEYKDQQGQCAQLLQNTFNRMFPKKKLSYSLTTTRHQFIANAKSYHPPEAVSAMAGHIITTTAIENYGRKSSAWGPEDIEDKAFPVAEEVATVKRRHVFYEDRKKLQEESGIATSTAN